MAAKNTQATGNKVGELLVEMTIKRIAWRGTLRARELRSQARSCWQDRKRSIQLKARAMQFDDLAGMLRECLEPFQETVPPATLNLGENKV